MKETLLMRVQPLRYCVTFASRKTPVLIHGKTNDVKIGLFITTTTSYKIIFVKIILTNLLTIRMDVAIVRTDTKFFEQIGKPFEQLTDRFKRLS